MFAQENIMKKYLIGIIGTSMFVGFVTYATIQTWPEKNSTLSLNQEQPAVDDAHTQSADIAAIPAKQSELITIYPETTKPLSYPTPVIVALEEDIPVVIPEPEITYEEEDYYDDEDEYEEEEEEDDEKYEDDDDERDYEDDD